MARAGKRGSKHHRGLWLVIVMMLGLAALIGVVGGCTEKKEDGNLQPEPTIIPPGLNISGIYRAHRQTGIPFAIDFWVHNATPDEIIFSVKAGTTFRPLRKDTPSLLVLQDQTLKVPSGYGNVKVKTYFLNRNITSTMSIEAFDMGDPVTNTSLLEIVELVQEKDLQSQPTSIRVQGAIFEAMESGSLSEDGRTLLTSLEAIAEDASSVKFGLDERKTWSRGDHRTGEKKRYQRRNDLHAHPRNCLALFGERFYYGRAKRFS